MAKPLRHNDPHRWPGREPSRMHTLFALLIIAAFAALIIIMLMNGG